MRTLTATFSYTANDGELKDHTTELDGSQTLADIQQEIAEKEQEQAEEQRGEDEGGETYTAEMIEISDMSTDEDTDGNDTIENIFTFAEAYSECDQDAEIVAAALKCDIQGNDIDEAYSGRHDSDADFAQEMCESCGDVPKDLPSYIYIDWERTAKDIMYDYCEHNGHYFRNM